MFRRLLTPRWLGAVVAAVLFAIAAYYLGHWQYGRHVAKVERNARLDAHFAADPVPVGSVLTLAPLAPGNEWTKVTMAGTYAAYPSLFVRNRTNAGDYGFEVLSLFELSGGGRVAVDRGFVPAKDTAADLPPLPQPPAGPVTITGWVRPTEASRNLTMPTGQLATLNLRDASAAWDGATLLCGYVRLESERREDGTVAERPAALDAPDRALGPHQAYAYQWWLSMPVGLVLIFFGIRRELRAEDPAYVPKPKKHRIWDDEDE